MIRFFNMFSDGSGVQAGLERAGNSLDLRLKAPHGAAVAATGARMEAEA